MNQFFLTPIYVSETNRYCSEVKLGEPKKNQALKEETYSPRVDKLFPVLHQQQPLLELPNPSPVYLHLQNARRIREIEDIITQIDFQ